MPPINHPAACVPKAVKATFCSKTRPQPDLVEATAWERVSPEIGHRPKLKRTFYEKNLTWQNPALICRFAHPEMDWLGWRILDLTPWSPDPKTDPRVLVCAQRGRGHILQQNSAVPFVWP